MTETPDFKQIAGVLLARVYEVRKHGLLAEVDTVAEQLQQLWNARGAADLAKFDAAVSEQLELRDGPQRTDLDLNAIVRAINELDR